MLRTTLLFCLPSVLRSMSLVFSVALASPVPAALWNQTNGPGVVGARAFLESGAAIFVATEGDGVWKTSNAGQSWTPANTGLAGRGTLALHERAGRLYAGVRDEGAGNAGVFRSTDGGAHWTPRNAGIESFSASSVLATASGLFAASIFSGIVRSTDDGATWQPVNSGLFNTSVYGLVEAGGSLFAATAGSGVFRSTNSGGSWEQIGSTDFFNLFSLTVDGTNLYAGSFEFILRSTNSGATWEAIEVMTGGFARFEAMAASGPMVYAGAAGAPGMGVFVSTNFGSTFAPLSEDLDLVSVESLHVREGLLLAGSLEKGVLRSTDDGVSWEDARAGLPPGGNIRLLFPRADDSVVAGTGGDGLFRSADQGQHWDRFGAGTALENQSVPCFAEANGRLYAGTFFGGIFRSTDDGDSWSAANEGLPPVEGLFVYDLEPMGSFVVAATGSGVFRSSNDGDDWDLTNLNPFQASELAYADGFGYALVNSGIGSSTGIYRTTDHGQNWSLVLNAGGNTFISLDAEGSSVFVGDLLSGMLRSPDHGDSWLDITPPGGAAVFEIFADLADLYVACDPATDLVYHSTNNGASWTAIGDGLPPGSGLGGLCATSSFLFVGTDEDAVWERPRSSASGVEPVDPAGPADPADETLSGIRIWVPAVQRRDGSLPVRFSLPSSGPARLSLVDAVGRSLRSMELQVGATRTGSTEVSLLGLPAGLYFVRIQAGGQTAARKIVVAS